MKPVKNKEGTMDCQNKSSLNASLFNSFPSLSIIVRTKEIQTLAKKHYGTELTEQECDGLFQMFNVDFSKVDESGQQGVVAHMVQAVVHAIGLIIDSHRHMRSK